MLPKIREILLTNAAFDENNTNLEQLAIKYNYEINPIEGCWCDLKWFTKKYKDQEYDKLNELITKAMEQNESKKLNIKLWKRFWLAIASTIITQRVKQYCKNFLALNRLLLYLLIKK